MVLWLLGAAGGLALMARYQFTPGESPLPAPGWPAASVLKHSPDRQTLLLLAHPRCPCTRASLAELQSVMERAGDRISAKVLFYKPSDAPPGWEHTDLWHAARSIPETEVLVDPDGASARLFGARTSGHILLYAPDGSLLFSGGITQGRGHEGDNAGRSTLIALVTGGQTAGSTHPVFGCALMERQSTGSATAP